MNVYFVLNGITFLWDDEKARINPRKHDGITFQQASEAFFDPFLVVVDASRNEEARDAVIGLDARWNLLYVVHIEREESVIRIISALDTPRRERTGILGSTKPLKLDSLQSLTQRWDSPQALIRVCPTLFAFEASPV
jgi:uncharacterized protein